jgi:hypothetical protein
MRSNFRYLPVLAVAALCLVVACGEPPPPAEYCGVPEGAPLRQETYRPLGLFLNDNPNLAQPGHLQRADNAVMREDFLEPARGFAQDVDPGVAVDAMYPWRIGDELHLVFRGENGTLYRRKVQTGATLSRTGSQVTISLVDHGIADSARVTVVESSNGTLFPPATFTVTLEDADTLTYTQAGAAGSATAAVLATPVAYSGFYSPPTGHPMRFWEAGGSLFFTTSEGPFRLDSPTATPVLSGAPQGLEGKVAVTNSTGGWLNYGETTGYRYTWSKRTATSPERILEGAPSGRMLLTNLVQDATPVSGAWTRVAAVVTITDTAHGLSNGDAVVVTVSSDSTALPLGVYTIANVTANTFDVTGVDAGGTSGTDSHVRDDDGVRNVLCTPYIPDGVVQGEDFCKVHRTVLTTTGGVDPGEDYALVAERYPTGAEITARTTTIEDIAPFANGADSYFSASAGGVSNALERAPLITDAIAFQDYIFGVAPLQRRAIPLALLAVNGDGGLTTFDGIQLANGGDSETYLSSPITANEGTAGGGGWIFGLYTTGSVSENIENTARSLVRVINLRSEYWYATYVSGSDDPPGRILIAERAIYAAASTIQAFRNQRAWSPLLRVDMLGDFSRTGSTVSVDVFTPSGSYHHLRVGDEILLAAGDPDFPDGVKVVSAVPSPSVFEYTEAGANVVSLGIEFTNNTDDVELESVLLANSWVYSAFQEWEAFPPASQVTLGGPTSELFRFEQFGTIGLFFNNEALWRLTGQDPTNFDVRPFPGGGESVRLFAPNTVAKNPAGVFALAEEGVLVATDTAFNPKLSEPIKPVIQKFVAGSEALRSATKTYAWGLGNEHEREYWLFLPDEAASSPSTTTQAYIFSAKAAEKGGTGWTRYTSGARTGVYSRVDQRMYLAPNTSGPLLRERRDNAASDFRNPTYTGGVSFVAEVVPFRGSSTDIDKQWVKAIVSPENKGTNPMPPFLGMDFSTSNNTHSTWYPDGPHQHEAFNGTYQTYVPEETCRGKELGMRLSHSTASEWLRITGITLWFNQAAR